MNKNTFCYKKGFALGIKIYKENLLNGYFADEDNLKAMKCFKYYAEIGMKDDQPLRPTQIEFYYGVHDGIKYQYSRHGTPINKGNDSNFEKYEKEHYYGKDSPYDGFGYYD